MSATLAHGWTGDRSRPPLVLSNSLGTTTAVWAEQQPLLEHFSLVSYDHPGHGASGIWPAPYSVETLARAVLSVLEDLGIERASFCGISLGGMVGLWLAAHAAHRIDRLAVLSAAPRIDPVTRYSERAAFVREHSLDSIAATIVASWFTQSFVSAHPEAVDALASDLRAASPEGYARCCDAIAACDLWADVPAIVAPTLIICGADDPVIRPATAAKLADAIPGSRLAEVAHAAHLVNVEQPDAVNTLLIEHFARSETRRVVHG